MFKTLQSVFSFVIIQTQRGQETVSEVTKELYDAGVAAERINTEKEKKRADAAEAELLKLREELEVLRKQKQK